MSGIRVKDYSKLATNSKNGNGIKIFWDDVIDVVLFLLSSLVTGPSLMSKSSLVLELWQFLFISDWSEIWKSEIPSSEFCSISGDWGKERIPNLARTSLKKCYWILHNARVTAFTVSELLREIQLGKGDKIYPIPLRLGLRCASADIKVHYTCPIFLNFFISFQTPCPGISVQRNVLTKLQFFSPTSNLDIKQFNCVKVTNLIFLCKTYFTYLAMIRSLI